MSIKYSSYKKAKEGPRKSLWQRFKDAFRRESPVTYKMTFEVTKNVLMPDWNSTDFGDLLTGKRPDVCQIVGALYTSKNQFLGRVCTKVYKCEELTLEVWQHETATLKEMAIKLFEPRVKEQDLTIINLNYAI